MIRYIKLVLLLSIFLVACSKEDKPSDDLLSKTDSSQQSTKTTAISNEQQKETSRFDLDMEQLADFGYKTPEGIDQYAGTYSVGGLKNRYDGIVIELSLNKDGSYRKLEKTYTSRDATMQNHYGYFDNAGHFQTKTFSTDVGGVTYFETPELTYTQGVVVEKYGDLYLVDLAQLSASKYFSYIAKDGDIDILFSLLRNKLEQTQLTPYVQPLLAIEDMDNLMALNEYDFSAYAIRTPLELKDDLSGYGSIKQGKITINGLELASSHTISEIVQKPLSEIITQELLAGMVSDINGLYQVTIGYGEDNPKVIDLSNVYKQSGEKLTPEVGLSSGYEGYTAYILDGTFIYRATETDGKYIIKE